jgi:cell division protein FtsB
MGDRRGVGVNAELVTDSLFALLISGGLLATFSTLVSMRSGRQRSFDSRLDKELERLRARNDELEAENDQLQARATRYRRLIINRLGEDPDDEAATR